MAKNTTEQEVWALRRLQMDKEFCFQVANGTSHCYTSKFSPAWQPEVPLVEYLCVYWYIPDQMYNKNPVKPTVTVYL